MQHDQFVGQVQARARLGSRGAAETATRASLETLAERVPSTLAVNLASQLPTEVGEHLRRVAFAADEPRTGVRMSRQEFFDRVAAIAGTRSKRLPAPLLRLAGAAAELAARVTGGPPELTRHSVVLIDRTGTVSARRARTELGWEPRVAFDQGLAETVAWYAQNRDWWEPLRERAPVVEGAAWQK